NVWVRRRVCSMRAGDPSERVCDENERATTTPPRLPHKMFRMLEMYYMLAGSLVCEQDWQKLMKSANTATPGAPVRKGKVGRPRRSRE
ncbi:putative LIM domain transcription factor LMO4, partial [Operophtera brumata]